MWFQAIAHILISIIVWIQIVWFLWQKVFFETLLMLYIFSFPKIHFIQRFNIHCKIYFIICFNIYNIFFSMTTLCIELMIYRVRIFIKSGGLKVKLLSIPTWEKPGRFFLHPWNWNEGFSRKNTVGYILSLVDPWRCVAEEFRCIICRK